MALKRFLFLSLDAALITELAWQVAREEHDVKYYIEAEIGISRGGGRRAGARLDAGRERPGGPDGALRSVPSGFPNL